MSHKLVDEVGPALVRRWGDEVVRDVAARAFTANELAEIGTDQPDPDQTRLAYGCTIVGVVGTSTALGVLQIGDGDVVCVAADRQVARAPLPTDPANVANITSSLSQAKPLDSLRVGVIDLTADPQLLVWASTDGYGGAFTDPQWWRQVGEDLAERAARLTPEQIKQRIPGWLREPAEVAGDDTTMAVLLRRPPPQPGRPSTSGRDTPTLQLSDRAQRTQLASSRLRDVGYPVHQGSWRDPRPGGRSRSRRFSWAAMVAGLVLAAALGFFSGLQVGAGGQVAPVPVPYPQVSALPNPTPPPALPNGSFVLGSDQRAVMVTTDAASSTQHPLEERPFVGHSPWEIRGTALRFTPPEGNPKPIELHQKLAAFTVHSGRVWVLTANGSQVWWLDENDSCLYGEVKCRPVCIPVGPQGRCPPPAVPAETLL
ncbi:MAG: protein phosphatase 2C domain-containing protein [Egibacteraceae bacterium]